MKMPRLFNRIRGFALLRLAVAGSFVLTAAALAFIATANNNSSDPVSKNRVVAAKATAQTSLKMAYEKSDEDSVAVPADEAIGTGFGPNSAAVEEHMNRAYPGPDEIDLGALINAQAGFGQFMANATPTPVPTPVPTATPPEPTPTPTAAPTATPKGGKKRRGKGTPTPAPTPAAPTVNAPILGPSEFPPLPIWQEVTGNSATDPNILTFTGSAQVVSGRITALAIDTFNGCADGFCRVWVAAAGGGIWRTTNALAATPTWSYVSGGPGGFVTNGIGALTYFNNGSPNGLLFAGTGEPNASGDSEAGTGLYKSTDGGATWTLLPSQIGPITTISPGTGGNGTYTGSAFLGRSISSIVVDPTNPNILYVSSARGVRGVSSVTGGATSNPTTPRPPYGVFKSVDGGLNFSYIFDGDPSCGPGTCLGGGAFSSVLGATELKLDPSNHLKVYTSNFPGLFGGGGVWRSSDGGATWVQILGALDPANIADRCAFDVTSLGGGVTRMYAGCGNDESGPGATEAHVFRSNNAQAGANFTDLSALEPPATPGAGGFTRGYCTSQCWYDNFVVTPPGFPNVVYVGGSYRYDEFGGASNGRGVVMTQNGDAEVPDGGAPTVDGSPSPSPSPSATPTGPIWNDMTWDAQDNGMPGPPFVGQCCNPNQTPVTGPAPNGIHPDQHAFVVSPSNPFLFFEGSDGGLTRSSGALTSIASQCVFPRIIDGSVSTGAQLFQCKELLGFFGGGVPTQIFSLNNGLRTLQFQSVSVASDNSSHFQGGTQDNGTFDSFGTSVFPQEIYGDGGQSGFKVNNSTLRFNSFFGKFQDVNFQNGAPDKWVVATAPIVNSGETSNFYVPIIADPFSSGTIFQGSRHVWRTTDWAGSQAVLEANCPEFTTPANKKGCGDFVALGGPAGFNTAGDLGGTFYGDDRRTPSSRRPVSAIARTPSNANVAWASTNGGRVFISTNINAGEPASVTWTRIDSTGVDPARFPSSIFIDPANAFHAWISYSGYNFNTPSQKGHVFSVTWDNVTGHLGVWTDISSNIWDIPITGVVFDSVTGDLYASSDFVVFRLAASNNPAMQWFIAGLNMPMVETAGLTILPGSRVLYAATHGRGVWRLNLP